MRLTVLFWRRASTAAVTPAGVHPYITISDDWFNTLPPDWQIAWLAILLNSKAKQVFNLLLEFIRIFAPPMHLSFYERLWAGWSLVNYNQAAENDLYINDRHPPLQFE
jgi:hypothetical protein